MSKLGLLMFCLRSLWREYGWGFVTRIVLRHPGRTAQGIRAFARRRRRGEWGDVSGSKDLEEFVHLEGTGPGPAVLGLGFCLKPQDPACPSGRANHDCLYFTRPQPGVEGDVIHAACRRCRIRLLGERALSRGWSLYIMTSARDILQDLLLPVLENRRFSHAVLGLCRYSFDPFQMALCVVGLHALLIPFESGDCRDYRSWRRADLGFKEEQTCFSDPDLECLLRLFPEAEASPGSGRVVKQGHVLCPH